MTEEAQTSPNTPEQPTDDTEHESGQAPESSADQLVEELGRLGRKFVEVVDTAWNSEQRHQLEKDLRSGLNTVAESLEKGLKDISEKEETREFVGKAEELADTVTEKVRSSEFAHELANVLASGLHALGDQLDRLARDIQRGQPGEGDQEASSETTQDIPITEETSEPPPNE